MARAHYVKRARRHYPERECGIKGGINKGQSYYWWKFRRSAKQFSLLAPKASQLTQSAFYSQLYSIQEQIENLEANSDLPGEVENIADELDSLAEEQESNRENMPESLQDSETGELLQERYDAVSTAVEELRGIELDEFEDEPFEEPTQDEGESDEEFAERVEQERDEYESGRDQREQEYWDSKLEEVQAVSIDV